MLHTVAFFSPLAVIEALQTTDEVSCNPADTLEVNSFPYKRFHNSSWVPDRYLNSGGSCFFSFSERYAVKQCCSSQKKILSMSLRGQLRTPQLSHLTALQESVSSA